jgi:hypothetical protein
MDYRKLIFIGFLLVLFGFLVPFLMVIKVMEPSFFWSFLSYGASVAGLFLGIVGGSLYVRVKRKPHDEDENMYNYKK